MVDGAREELERSRKNENEKYSALRYEILKLKKIAKNNYNNSKKVRDVTSGQQVLQI